MAEEVKSIGAKKKQILELFEAGKSPKEIMGIVHSNKGYVYECIRQLKNSDGEQNDYTRNYLKDVITHDLLNEWDAAVQKVRESWYDLSKIRIVKEKRKKPMNE